MKIRSDSVYAQLGRAGLLDEFFAWVYEEHPGYKDIRAWLSERDLPHSDGAIHTLLRVHSIHWRVERAELRAAATAQSLPDNTDELIRRQLKAKEFDLAFADLTSQETLSVLRFDLDKRSAEFAAELERQKLDLKRESEERARQALELQREKFRRETCALFAKWAQDKRAMEIASAANIGADEKVEQLGMLIFGEDW